MVNLENLKRRVKDNPSYLLKPAQDLKQIISERCQSPEGNCSQMKNNKVRTKYREKEKDIEDKGLKKLKKMVCFSFGGLSEATSSIFTGYPEPFFHEHGHKIAAEALGYDATVEGHSTYVDPIKTSLDNLAISLGGPLMNLGVAGALYGLSHLAGKRRNDSLESYLKGISFYESLLASESIIFPKASDGTRAAEALSDITPLNSTFSSLLLSGLFLLPTALSLYFGLVKPLFKKAKEVEEDIEKLSALERDFKDEKLERMLE